MHGCIGADLRERFRSMATASHRAPRTCRGVIRMRGLIEMELFAENETAAIGDWFNQFERERCCAAAVPIGL
jgi:hypothetical protein